MAKKHVLLQDHLILNSYLCSLFGKKEFKDFQSLLKDTEDGFDEGGRSYAFLALVGLKGLKISKDKLEKYDTNIKGYVDHINRKRENPIELKYFQYLSVLFIEIYLDKYFEAPVDLMNELNNHVPKVVSREKLADFSFGKKDLTKLAFWMATGSGKTLIMHINYLQFLKYNQGPHAMKLDNILLITPNEALSDQHIEEMRESNIPCDLFTKDGGGYFSSIASQSRIKVLDIHKLTEEKKGQGITIDVEDFGRRNIIFVDEGHKGSGGVRWRKFREFVADEGFTFEYSATFGQAIASAGNDTEDLLREYGKAIIFDYSYRYFYKDGYGKEYRILNLRKDLYKESSNMLMLANLLSFYEQKLLFEDYRKEVDEYNIEAPLWIFVGSKVTGVSTQTVGGKKEETSDLLRIVMFLAKVLQKRDWTENSIGKILTGKSGLMDIMSRDLFSPDYPEKKLTYLKDKDLHPDQIYKDLLKKLFHVGGPSPLHLINLKSAQGEIALRAGDSEFFGVINIGDDSRFLKLVEEKAPEISRGEDQMTPSLFDAIKEPGSKINLLIGAKKFIEGWDCWRVSNMGLLNIGKKEGSQIIQLFGRGVRLRGKDSSLKRSRPGDQPPKYLRTLETLNIFGIEANYMDIFTQLLDAEGIETGNYIEVPLPIETNASYLEKDLLVPRVDITKFNEEEFFPLEADKVTATVNLMPIVDIITSLEEGLKATASSPRRNIDPGYLDLLDWDRIYFSLLEHKQEKGWNNVVLTKKVLKQIMEKGLYSLYCPEEIVKPRKFADIWHLEEAVISVLKKFLQSFYSKQKNMWATKNMKVVKLTVHDENLRFEYSVKVNEKDAIILSEVQEIASKKLEEIYRGEDIGSYVTNVYFDRHIYQPLLAESAGVEISPAGLNDDERQFIQDLRDYFVANPGLLRDREVFVLRNRPRVGVGFCMKTTNYYPDFIIWVKAKDRQHLIFVDPHGLGHAWDGLDDEKIQWHSGIKDVEKALVESGKQITLDSYIISVTSYASVKGIFQNKPQSVLKDHHILFLEDRGTYIKDLMREALNT